jgi:hypothetical protein
MSRPIIGKVVPGEAACDVCRRKYWYDGSPEEMPCEAPQPDWSICTGTIRPLSANTCKVVSAPGTGPGPWEDVAPDLSRAFADIRAGHEREAQLRRELLAAEKQRDEAIGLLRMWRKQRSVAAWGAIEERTDAFLRGIDQENKDKP